MLFSLFFACLESVPNVHQSNHQEQHHQEQIVHSDSSESSFETGIYPADFPSNSDLAILFDLNDLPVITSSTRLENGSVFLPLDWVRTVSEAYSDTDVGDALELENFYSDWQVVSIRLVPCDPLGITPDQNIDSLCWPMVRMVWQPVLRDYQTRWGTYVDAYADDRAIHALYPLQARSSDGNPFLSVAKENIARTLANGIGVDDIDEATLSQFMIDRNKTVEWFLREVFNLRSTTLAPNSWDNLDVRPELYLDTTERYYFDKRLLSFLDKTADPRQLVELTSFSLPEGRNPAGSDVWVFLAFEGNDGELTQKELTVIDRNSGEELINVGFSQSVTMSNEDPFVEDVLESGNQALQDSLVIDTDDVGNVGEEIADGYQFLVPNTSCASCHKLNEIRFDFHNLSHLEDQKATISPRVVQDVKRDIAWSKVFQW